MIRFGLCCVFLTQPIKFRRTTAKFLSRRPKKERLQRLSGICLSNADNLMKALEYCHAHKIGCFRINSQILPLKTHWDVGYDVADLPDGQRIVEKFKACGQFSRDNDIRTTFHPDQFIVLSSPRTEVVKRSIADLVYQAEVAEWVNADVINVHAGGVYGDKTSALKRLQRQIDLLPRIVRGRLTLENDDRSYTPADLLPICLDAGIPLVYDIHHHRCLNDRFSEEEAFEQAIKTWNREPLFHVSSPLYGWSAKDIRPHHDYIDIHDFPKAWLSMDLTVEVEAKAKELAVLKLMKDVAAL